MGYMKLPRTILFDLDDTILVAFGPAPSQWQRSIAAFADQLGPIEVTAIAAAIEAASTELWADPARHKYWRHRTAAARHRIVATAFAALAAAGHAIPTEVIGDALADAYNALHDEELSLFPYAHETLDRLKELGIKLALITNAPAEPQRAKVVRFRPRTAFRRHPDRGRARLRQARGASLQSCDGSARRRAGRDLDGRRQS
jgi:putative hydrolase of the HAD superfamily